jgi:hypothetical protein
MHHLWPLIRLAAVVAAVAGPGYVIACALFPFAACRWCEGSGRKSTSSKKAWRNCRHCKGSGKRLRLGRKIYNHLRRVRKDAT